MGIAGSGLTVHRKWLDAVSDNLSNMNNVALRLTSEAFQQRYVLAQAVDYGSGRGSAQVAGVDVRQRCRGRDRQQAGQPARQTPRAT